MIAVSHPGKIGDMLYALPTARELSRKYNTKVDFYTSQYCYPAKSLIEYQTFVNQCIIPSHYSVNNFSCGGQPWDMNIRSLDKVYDAIYELGFNRYPDCSLPDFIAKNAGVTITNIKYDYDTSINEFKYLKKYVVLAPMGSGGGPVNLFLDFINKCKYPIVQIGAVGQFIGIETTTNINRTGMSLLDTLPIIANSCAFVGCISSQLVLANGFNIPRIAYSDGMSDGKHLVYGPYNYLVTNPQDGASQFLHIIYMHCGLPV